MLTKIGDSWRDYPTETSKWRLTYSMYGCSECGETSRLAVAQVKNRGVKTCRECSFKRPESDKIYDSKTRLYTIWDGMKQRAKDKNFKSYEHVTMCAEWINSFEVFKTWAWINGYTDELTIDRIDGDGNYEPSNCRWANRTVQARNIRITDRNTSGFIGASKHKRTGKWYSQLKVDYKTVNLGSFDYPWTAAYARDAYILKHNLEHTKNFKEVS